MGLIALGGYAVIRTGEFGVKKGVEKGIKLVKKHNKDKSDNESKNCLIYDVINSGHIEEGVDVQVGDKIKVCAIDKEAVLIEILGNKNNPYFIDFDLLKSIVDYK